MISSVFEHLTGAVSSTPIVAIFASVAWGILSVILSPCHLASIPLIIGFIGEQGVMSARRAFLTALSFALGILVTIGLIGVATGLAGRMLGDLGPRINYFVAILFFVIGLHLLGLIPMPFSARTGKVGERRGLVAAFVLGLVFGLALGPCTFAYMAPMLGVTLTVARTNMAYGILLLGAFGVGHCSVIVAAGTFTEVVERYLKWSDTSKGLDILKKICGALVMLGGVYLLWTA
ncbi:MAG TPA: cytochrome c biogenesis protein CcdA [bacterium]|nr:cytochrome c biogenesis protein CcdA [bacterium]